MLAVNAPSLSAPIDPPLTAPLRDWFAALYQVLLGADQGPRFGGFVALYGIDETRGLIERALAGELVDGTAT